MIPDTFVLRLSLTKISWVITNLGQSVLCGSIPMIDTFAKEGINEFFFASVGWLFFSLDFLEILDVLYLRHSLFLRQLFSYS